MTDSEAASLVSGDNVIQDKALPEQAVPIKRATRTRDALCKALLLLLEEKSLEQITVREITQRANVGYATFFRRYPDKEALLHDLAAQEISRLLAMTMPIFYKDDTLASTNALCQYVWENKTLWRALLTGGAAATLKEEFLQHALAIAQEFTSDTNNQVWLPNELAVTFSVTGILEILGWWLKLDSPISSEEMAEIINKLVIAPLCS